MGISGVNGIGGMQDYSIQAPDYSRQPAKTVITEVATGIPCSIFESDRQLSCREYTGGREKALRQCGTGGHLHYFPQAG